MPVYDESAIDLYTTPSGLQRYRLPVICAQLNKHRYVSSDTMQFAIHLASLQEMIWATQWQERAALKHRKLGLEMNAKRPDLRPQQKKKIAEARTEIAQNELAVAYQLLSHALGNDRDFDWGFFKKCPEYPFPKPTPPQFPAPPPKPILSREPQPTDFIFQPQLDPIDKLVPVKRHQKEQEARERFHVAHKKWQQVMVNIRRVYQQQITQYQETCEQLKRRYQQEMQQWEQGRAHYLREREKCIQMVERKSAAYLAHEPHAVLDYFDMALAHSNYPHCFPHSFELDYYTTQRVLIVDYLLPALKVLPRLARVIYREEDNAFHEILLSEEERSLLYAKVLHEIPLRTFYELFKADIAVSLAAIQFRGYLFLDEDKETGRPPTKVVEVQADRAIFAAVDLYHGDPALIFENLGGVIHPLE